MARKVTMTITAEVTVNMDDGVEMCDLDLDLINQNDNGDVEDFQITDSKVTDSR
jgi:hypothetical protein